MEWERAEKLFWKFQLGFLCLGLLGVVLLQGLSFAPYYLAGAILISAQFKLIALIVKGTMGAAGAVGGAQVMVWLGLKVICWGGWAAAILWLPKPAVRAFALGCAPFFIALLLMPILLRHQQKG